MDAFHLGRPRQNHELAFDPRARAGLLGALACLCVAAPALAHAADADPASTTAAAPASAELPAICTDRPTKANAPCTVEPGHWQYETDLLNGTFFRINGVTTDTYLVTNPTLKYGLSKTLDIEINIAPYEVVRSHDQLGNSATLTGIGDFYVRLKYNLHTSADGAFSVAILPYVKAPTARDGIGNGAVEAGAILPISYKLNDKVTFLSAPEVDALKDSTGDGRHVNTAQLAALGYSLPRNVTLYAELWGDWNFDPVGAIRQYSADVDVTWGLTNYLQLDSGLNLGLNRQTPGVQFFVGVSQKF